MATTAPMRESVCHHPDQRPIAEAHHGRRIDTLYKCARLVGGEHRRLATLHDVLRPADGVRRVGCEHAAADEPVEQHSDCCQVLLNRRLLEIFSQGLDVGGDVQRLDVGQLTDPVSLAPGEESSDRMQVCGPRVPVADGGGEEFQEASGRVLAGIGDEGRHHDGGRGRGDGSGGSGDGQATPDCPS
jgi:hypothetical protein